MIGLGTEPEKTTCSRAGCREAAGWRVDWRNPRIHSADRVKTWLACDEHVDYLRDFLASRDFPVSVVPLAPSPEAEPA
ncbi:hypothetical protein E3T26_15890 [Cryobacterium sp. TMT1-21]|uniref:Acetone carboxylase n=1 Tax=Cryobacterium shii TaxID=1259235 RepID=A0AAQ2HFW5_9MICO|nr:MULTISPECIES: hypothetical protein [Cryobacterium]TFC48598.1 hypothetical protein E3O49_07380 [Cryobacterium shii]TFC81801.1 hypothetical protein E3T24_14540 [Cryobacterium sp. TmT2-59]TFD08293.1 hypothetical protein E3T26_15890 [Cryobacterium sp. TMT1-21]TFD20665.1 hypothetical protein E3T42_01805 [Cryobacterium sp. TMT4-10]TFD24685.1 hypothetical protein E3T32_04850 [Cryobacterium sp. TMT2-23]